MRCSPFDAERDERAQHCLRGVTQGAADSSALSVYCEQSHRRLFPQLYQFVNQKLRPYASPVQALLANPLDLS